MLLVPVRKKSFDWWLNMLLFSGLGMLCLYLILHFIPLSRVAPNENLVAPVYACGVVVFNCIGFFMLYINRRINLYLWPELGNWTKMVGMYLLSAVMLFAFNYLLLVCIKFVFGSSDIFALRVSGVRSLFIVWLVELVVLGLITANNFYRHMLRLQRHARQLEDSNLTAQYKALQSQLNPHFLFNSLNVLIAEIEYNPKNAVQFTRCLSDVYRYILRCQDLKLVTLREELEFLESYVYLHRVRLGDCVEMKVEIPDDMMDLRVPPLTLQLLVENMFKHNMVNPRKPLSVEIAVDAEEGTMTVSNAVCLKKDVKTSGKGLKNLERRYLLLCGKGIEVVNSGNRFSVKVPLLNE